MRLCVTRTAFSQCKTLRHNNSQALGGCLVLEVRPLPSPERRRRERPQSPSDKFSAQKFDRVRFIPESGHVRCTGHVRFVPIADIALLDGLDLKQSVRSHNRIIATGWIEVFVYRTERGESRHRDRIFETGAT